MKTLKKSLAALLVVLMLLTSAPIQAFTGIELPDWFSNEAEAVNVNYCSTAAAQWAIDHWNDYYSVLYNLGYWDNGGDCANFVSQCLYMGGLNMDTYWNISGYNAHWGTYKGSDYEGSYIRCQQLYNYLVKIGAQVIRNPKASDVSIGDVILYSREGASRMTHTAIVIDIKNGEPVVAAHSTYGVRYRSDNPYQDWHLNFKPERTYLMKMNGSTCVNQNHKSFDVYVATGSDTRLYKSTSTSSGYYNTFLNGDYPDYAHVYKKSSDGKWGYTFRYGSWGWIRLSSFRYLSHQESPKVDHNFGNWKVVTVADCKSDGLDKRTCARCGYEEKRTTQGGHIIDPQATCLSGGFCKVCGEQCENPLGHDWNAGTITKQPTCTQEGIRSFVCNRDSSHTYTEPVDALGHDYELSVTSPSCTSHGESIYTCTRCSDSYIGAFNKENAWTDWTTDSSLATTLSSDRVQKKTQYRYKDRQFTESSSSSLTGWELYNTVRTSWGATQGPVYSNPTNGSRNVWSEQYISSYHQKYVYQFYKWGASPLDYSYTYQTSSKPTKYTVVVDYLPSNADQRPIAKSGSTYRWHAENTGSWAAVYKESEYYTNDTSRPIYSTRWYYQEPVYTYYFRKWADNWSAWQDVSVSATDNRLVETRTVYKYNLSELGHDFKVTGDLEFVNTNTLNAPDPCYITGGKVCSRCGLRIEPDTTVNHSYPAFYEGSDEWEVISDDGMTKVYRAYCYNGCGCYIEETTVECTWIKTVIEPTCTTDGYTRNECSCGEHSYNSDFKAALEHYIPENDEGEVILPATCTEAGIIRHYCVRYDDGVTCNHYIDDPIAPLGHEMVKYEDISETCLTDGQTEYYQCEICKKFYADEEGSVEIEQDSWIIKATGHVDASEVEWIITDENGCGKTGWKKKICDNINDNLMCGAVVAEEEIPEIPADYYVAKADNAEFVDGQWKPTSCVEDGILYVTCRNCEHTDKAHSSQPNVVYEQDPIGRLEHELGGKAIIKEAYCIYPGQYEIHCNRCTTLLEEGEIEAPFVEHALVEIKADGGCVYNKCTNSPCTYTEGGVHNFQRDTSRDKTPTCTEDGIEAYTCTKCSEPDDKVLEMLGHNHVLYETIDSKCIESGYSIYKCNRVNNGAVCGDEYTDDYTEPLGHETIKIEAVKPLCESDGNYEYYICQRDYCKKIFFDEECFNETSIEHTLRPAIGHDWDSGVIDPASTCKLHGTKTYTCQNDSSHKKTESVNLNPDNHVGETYIKNAKTENCTEDGYTGDKYCSDCDALLESGEVLPSHGHDYHKIAEKCKAPDYGVAGYDYYECNYDASHNYKVDIDPLVKTTFTATFITTAPFFDEDKVVGTVTFEQGDSFVDEPEVESYDNYTFAWDEYELKDEDITIYGRYTEIEIDDVTELDPDKEARDLGGGIVNITLEAKAASKKIKVITANPVDVILVLDQSGSMAETLSSDGTTKRDALVKCANDFVKALYDNADETGLDHRVALVGFSYSNYNGEEFTNDKNKNPYLYRNTGILATTDGKSVNYNDLSDFDYSTALIPVVDNGNINANITNGINSVKNEGATAADLGLKMAKNIFAETEKTADRERIVLFITDGTPTSWGEQSDLVKDVAAAAITEANSLKNEQGAIIYSIGVHANSDPTAEFTSDIYGVKTDNRGNFQSYDFNRFLHAVSSNYPNAGSIKVSEMGKGNKNSGYYFAVNDTSKLSDIFTKILYGKVYKVVTFDKVTLFDTVSEDFTLTLEQETEMRERLIKEQGMKNEDITVTRNADGTTSLRFENVRAQKVYNADGSSYYSAKVSFNVSANENSLDKSGEVDTNTDDAGIEYDGTVVEDFDVQSINLEADRKIVVFTINGVVYRIDEANLGDEIVAPESELAKWNIPEGTIVEDKCAIFEADVIDSTEYVVTWNSEGTTKTETYSYGSVIKAPEAAEKEGYDFLKWSPSVPATMPNYNMTFTAVYTPKHTHNYSAVKNYGKCTEGITTVYECACGDSYEETAEIKAHSVKVVISKTWNGTLIEKVTCDVCGASNSQELTYKVTYKEKGRTSVLDLTLLENDISVQPDGTIEIRFYLGEDIDKNYTVKRIDENGRSYDYTPRKENGYLIFDADHFSFYVVIEIDEVSSKPAEDLSYGEVYCISNGHSYSSKTVSATCTATGYTMVTCSVCGDSYKDIETAALGHSMSAYTVTKQPTCTDNGTETAKCSRCDHSDMKTVKANGHNYDSNGNCKDCGNSKVQNCKHLCHKSGFMGFIWKIVRFFWKLFKIQPTCDCGVKHY